MPCESMPFDPVMARLLKAEGRMQRDLDYVRKMLADMEASDDWLHQVGLDDDAPDANKAIYHAKLMQDEGLLERVQPGFYRMTAKGHDFLANTSDPTVWDRSKDVARKMGGHSLTMLGEIAEGYVRVKIREFTGLDI